MKIKSILSLLSLILISAQLSAQKWAKDMQDPKGNLYKIQAEFEAYWSTRDITEKGKGYKAFKRWENFVAPRVYPSGDLSLLGKTGPNWMEYLKSQPTPTGTGKNIGSGQNLISSATWTAMGPNGPLVGNAGGQLLKSGRLNFVTVDPTNTLNLWVGAPAGGLWNSTNGGASWTTNTDQLPVIGCSDLAIDPTNTNILYLATGDGDAGDTRSIGVLKSTDGGLTWSATGLTAAVSANFLIRRLLINPNNTQIIFAATSSGIYRTTNGGTSWTLVNNQGTYDLEFKPGNPNIVYAGGNNFRMSTNGGASFVNISNGLSSTGFQRAAIAVTPADTNYVYVLGASGVNSGFLGLYRSVTGGTSFAVMSSSATINLLGWNTNGQDVGGQGWYDLSLAASPLDKDEIVTGGVNIWRSLNGGSTWAIYSHWTGSGAPFSHADQHDLEFAANGTLFNCNDGTVYRRTSTTWQEISGSMNISQIYKIGLSSLSPNTWITGHQDNGTSVFTGGSYNAELGGDGMDCFIDRTNDQNMFGSYQNGSFQRTNNAGVSWSVATTGITGTAPWVTTWKQDPQNASTLYAGRVNLFKSTNLAASWTQLAALPGTGGVVEFAIAPSNNQVIYVLKNAGVYKTTTGGTSWSTITGSIPVGSGAPQFVTIDPTDPNNAWVVLSGYTAGAKVYMTTDGGATWTNYSANLPNLPANCSVYQPGTNDMIYVGMDVGIYYRSSSMSQWTLYNTGLPNAPIADMEISPATPGIIHAATFGRGVYIASVFAPSQPPASLFTYASNVNCAGAAITFTDQSVNNPTSWAWSVFPSAGVSINSATLQNPAITFGTPGMYTVALTTANAFGPGNIYSLVINIVNGTGITAIANSQSICPGGTASFSVSGATSYTWSNGGGSGSTATFTPVASSVYTVSGAANGCITIKTLTAVILGTPTVGISGPNVTCAGSPAVLTASGAVSYTWDNASSTTSILVNPTVTTSYSITGGDANGCQSTAFAMIGVNPLPVVTVLANDSSVCAGEEVILSVSGALNYSWAPVSQSGDTLINSPSITTTFTCFGTDNKGCVNKNSVTVQVAICEGITSFENKSSVYSVFPNPTKNKLTVVGKDLQETVMAQIIDVSGKVIMSQQLHLNSSAHSADIHLNHLAAGTYFIKITAEKNRTETIRFIKE